MTVHILADIVLDSSNSPADQISLLGLILNIGSARYGRKFVDDVYTSW
jgi:hypothetical protein